MSAERPGPDWRLRRATSIAPGASQSLRSPDPQTSDRSASKSRVTADGKDNMDRLYARFGVGKYVLRTSQVELPNMPYWLHTKVLLCLLRARSLWPRINMPRMLPRALHVRISAKSTSFASPRCNPTLPDLAVVMRDWSLIGTGDGHETLCWPFLGSLLKRWAHKVLMIRSAMAPVSAPRASRRDSATQTLCICLVSTLSL